MDFLFSLTWLEQYFHQRLGSNLRDPKPSNPCKLWNPIKDVEKRFTRSGEDALESWTGLEALNGILETLLHTDIDVIRGISDERGNGSIEIRRTIILDWNG